MRKAPGRRVDQEGHRVRADRPHALRPQHPRPHDLARPRGVLRARLEAAHNAAPARRQRAQHRASRHSRHCDLRSQRKICRFTVELYLRGYHADHGARRIAHGRQEPRQPPEQPALARHARARGRRRASHRGVRVSAPQGSISGSHGVAACCPRRVRPSARGRPRVRGPRRRPPVLLRARHPDSRALVQRHRPAVCTAGTSRTWRTNKATCARRSRRLRALRLGRKLVEKVRAPGHAVWQAQLSRSVGDRHGRAAPRLRVCRERRLLDAAGALGGWRAQPASR